MKVLFPLPNEIAFCPFCKCKKQPSVGREYLVTYSWLPALQWTVKCENQKCGAKGPLRATRKNAIKAWNKSANVLDT